MSLHINKNRDNSSELEHDDLDNLVPEWFEQANEWFKNVNKESYKISQQARSWGKTETVSNLIWQSFN